MKERHASGLLNCHTEIANRKRAASIKKGWDAGTRKQRDPKELREHLNAAREKRDMENVVAANRKIGEARRGKENPPGPSAKGPDHWAAKNWRFRSPCGITIGGKNLNHLIRENSHLFDPADVAWKKSQCRAARGLASLFGNNGKHCSWKGWIALCESE